MVLSIFWIRFVDQGRLGFGRFGMVGLGWGFYDFFGRLGGVCLWGDSIFLS